MGLVTRGWQVGPGVGGNGRAGGERLRCGPAGRSRRRQVGPAAQEGRARSEPGCGAGVLGWQRKRAWAAEALGRSGSGWARGKGSGPRISVGFGFVFYFPFSFLFLLQTKFEFKYKFEFKQHSNKNMHQHECNTRIKPMINFKSLRNKIELNALLNTINLRKVNKAN